MTRLPDYRSRLFAVIAKYERTPFEYGSLDCGLFASEIVEAITGDDPAKAWRGRYKTLRGGLRLMRKDGYNDQVDWLAKHATEIERPFAQVGDIAVLPADGGSGYTLGVVGGSFVIAPGPTGLVRVPLSNALRCYRVG